MVTVPPLVAALLIGPALRPARRWGHLLPSAPLLDRPGRRLVRPRTRVAVPALFQWRHGAWRRGEARGVPPGRAGPGGGWDLANARRTTEVRFVERAARSAATSVATSFGRLSAAGGSTPQTATPGVPASEPPSAAMPPLVVPAGTTGPALLWPVWRDRMRWHDALALRSHGLLAPDGIRRASPRDPHHGTVPGLDTALRAAGVIGATPEPDHQRSGSRHDGYSPDSSPRTPSARRLGTEPMPPAWYRTPVARDAADSSRTTVAAGGRPPARVPPAWSDALAGQFAPALPTHLTGRRPADAASLARRVTTEVTTRLTTVVQQEVARLAAGARAEGPEPRRPAAPPLALPLDQRTATALLTQLRDLAREERFRYGLGR